MEQQERSKMLGSMKMTSLVPKVSVPIMISMLVQALYNVVDSMFVAKYDPDALTAVSLAYPIQVLMIAVSTGLGVGINSLISRRLGEKRVEDARDAAKNGFFLLMLGYLLFLIFGLFFDGLFFRMSTKDETLRALGETYTGIVTIFSFGLFFSIGFERLVQATGNTMLSMIMQLVGAITNIILDPIMIFGYCGCPKMGIAGAAIATVAGQMFSMVLGFILNQTKNPELKLSFRRFRPKGETMKNILTVGFPSIIMQSISSVMSLLFNLILMPFGNAAVSVLGVYFKLQSFVFMPVFGLSNGLVAIVGYNYGARLKKRVYESVKVALVYAIAIMAAGMVLFMAIPNVLMGLFDKTADGSICAIGAPALRIISTHFILAAIGITLSTVFQAIGKGFYSLIMSLCRQLIVLIPVAWLLSRAGLETTWWSFPIAEVVSLTICLLLYRKVDREILSRLDEPAEFY
ncbi:MAG: MATE family efflux transporter [Clostridia bacterium]|nr:MATE family efflux transporter [Clostridia bacterium]